MPEEVAADLTARDAEVTEETMEIGVENPTERVNEVTDEIPEERKMLTATDEEGRIKRATPRDEAARARAATDIYQRRLAKEEASRKKSTEEQQQGTPGKEAEGVVEGQKGELWNNRVTGGDSFLMKSQTKRRRKLSSH